MQYFDLPYIEWKASMFALNRLRFALTFSESISISTSFKNLFIINTSVVKSTRSGWHVFTKDKTLS